MQSPQPVVYRSFFTHMHVHVITVILVLILFCQQHIMYMVCVALVEYGGNNLGAVCGPGGWKQWYFLMLLTFTVL